MEEGMSIQDLKATLEYYEHQQKEWTELGSRKMAGFFGRRIKELKKSIEDEQKSTRR